MAATGGINSLPTAAPGGRACAVAFGAIGFRCRARSAAGAMWRCRTTSAPWAARGSHTSVIDAAGAIYVIGGAYGGGTYFHDVWVSTNGGARPDSVGGVWSAGALGGYYRGDAGGTQGYSGGTRGVLGVINGTKLY